MYKRTTNPHSTVPGFGIKELTPLLPLLPTPPRDEHNPLAPYNKKGLSLVFRRVGDRAHELSDERGLEITASQH
jgi:hypothetical protein